VTPTRPPVAGRPPLLGSAVAPTGDPRGCRGARGGGCGGAGRRRGRPRGGRAPVSVGTATGRRGAHVTGAARRHAPFAERAPTTTGRHESWRARGGARPTDATKVGPIPPPSSRGGRQRATPSWVARRPGTAFDHVYPCIISPIFDGERHLYSYYSVKPVPFIENRKENELWH